ncbi:hypothetical protein [Aulosira sp. FACHB-615]|uniref:hypothetical protein n=1 Tax=Aulosira sp. FACHB-615 TaxID=2692777 RepID=UPI001687449C|nr:hypothetical protein [Aulosira sp. FACHB-615]MBD2487629.1 hypothetical protein [Aulosira sp. FACHB-615]
MTYFFSEFLPKNADPAYSIIRDQPQYLDDKKFIEEMWLSYEQYADTNFLEQSKIDFNQRIWEMYLACSLIFQGLSIDSKDEGPDILIDTGELKIWIEAVAPKPGQGVDAVSQMEFGVLRNIPDEKIKLRYRSAIEEKYNKKYKNYLAKKIVKPEDCYIIAINGSSIPSARRELEIPRIIRSVLPFGNESINIDTESGMPIERFYQYQDSSRKQSGASVSTDIFFKEEYSGISAILFSCMDVLNRPNEFGDDFVLLHNPLATRQFPQGFFKLGREYWVDNSSLKCITWSTEGKSDI